MRRETIGLGLQDRPTDSAAASCEFGANLAPGARHIAPYAARAETSLGRYFPESPCPTRSAFQRDRDRIIHSTAFRRLTHKTQVFLYHEGDHYRTRLTHSLEVAQIARTVARQLCLDEDLAETIALAHDLGHPPFGHAGERALQAALKRVGGFDHNAQSLRIVTTLERKYKDHDGLNLTWESLEGLAKHNGPIANPETSPVGRSMREIDHWQPLLFDRYASAEAQVAALADDIAYVTHDLDDGMRAGLIAMRDLSAAPLVGPLVRALKDETDARAVYSVLRQLITILIRNCVDETRQRLAHLAPMNDAAIRESARPVVAFSNAVSADLDALKAFLFARVYRHDRVMRVMEGAAAIVRDLVARYCDDPAAMPAQWVDQIDAASATDPARVVGDFVAGMTDRLAISEHRRLFDATPELR